MTVRHEGGEIPVGDLQAATGALRAARARQSVARLDFLRGLRDVTRNGLATQSVIARELGISQSAVSQNLQEEAKLAPVREGFHGADPQEIIARFVAGDLSHAQIVDELARWPYAPSDEREGPMGDLLVTVRGSFDDVEDAAVSGALPADVYREILARLAEQNDTSSLCQSEMLRSKPLAAEPRMWSAERDAQTRP